MLNRRAQSAQRALFAWALLGLLACALLPWYFPQDLTIWAAMRGAWAGEATGSALTQALEHGRAWLALVMVALAVAGFAGFMPAGRAQGRVLVAASVAGLLVVLGGGFAVGLRGWSFDLLNAWFGELPRGQIGLGLGGAFALLSLLMVLGAGLARLGRFRGDLFVAGAVVLCSGLLLLFVALPVGKALMGAFLDDTGAWSIAVVGERLGNERIWGLACLAGGVLGGREIGRFLMDKKQIGKLD